MRKYWAIFQIQLQNGLAYPADLALRSLAIVIFMWIFTQLWKATYSFQGSSNGELSGLTLSATLWYLMLAETIVLSKPRLARSIAQAVKDGSIAYILNKPYNFLVYQASIGLGDSIISMVFNLIAGGVTVWILVGPPPDPRGWPMALLAMLLGWLIDFCFAALIGLAAFITEDISAFDWIYSKMILLLGGVLIPLDFFPGWLRTVVQNLPFAFVVHGPARFFVEPSLARFALLLGGQLAWLSILGLITLFVYQRGMARLSINGG